MLNPTRFQTFDTDASPAQGAPRVAALRAELARRGLTGLVIPRGDRHMGEYVAPHDERLSWISGFTGSAGAAVVLATKAAVFIDGRYTLQVRDQVDGTVFDYVDYVSTPVHAWLMAHLKAGDRLGFDPWLHTADGAKKLADAAAAAGAELVALDDNPLDAVWTDQPPPPRAKAVVHGAAFAGEDAEAKRVRIGAAITEGKAEAAVLTLPESICWLLNIRGRDVPHTPFAHAFAILHGDGHVELFIDPAKRSAELDAHLGNGVTPRHPDAFGTALAELGGRKARVQIDPMTAPAWAFRRLEGAGATIVSAADPCLLPKACKNAVEQAGARAAHRRDGAALSRYLAWFATEAPKGGLDEITAVEALEDFRRATGALEDVSFDTISGSGPNGAIVHYRVTTATNRRIAPGELFLVDSGGQYREGTTDVTRTVAVGTPTAEQRDRFTRVLKGHIALARAIFPEGTSGYQLDTLARLPLWEAGLDYDHGTGHGVGSFLSVHEGPQSISKKQIVQPLKPGMICSNEPGYYKTGAYGIRIENLILVQTVDVPGAERPTLGFETLTLVPIDLALVEPALLSPEERLWLNTYHAQVFDAVAPQVDDATKAWLAEATRAI